MLLALLVRLQLNGEDAGDEAAHPSPGQLCSQLSDLQGELQVDVLTLSHCPQQAAVLLIQLTVSVLQFSHCS